MHILGSGWAEIVKVYSSDWFKLFGFLSASSLLVVRKLARRKIRAFRPLSF
jgi:hypothetical protein